MFTNSLIINAKIFMFQKAFSNFHYFNTFVKTFSDDFRQHGSSRSYFQIQKYRHKSRMIMNIKPEISWADFEKIDIRCGTIIAVYDFEKARNPSYQLEIDFGDLGIKKSSAQITSLYQKEDLVGQQILAVVNFPKKQIANFFSECLVLGLYGEDQNDVTLLTPSLPTKNGMQAG